MKSSAPSSPAGRRRIPHAARICFTAVAPLLALTSNAIADYVFTGPDGGQWNVPGNWTKASGGDDTVEPIAFYAGDTASGSDTAQIININNHVADGNAHTIFNLGSATATIGRLYVGSTNTGPGSSMTSNGWNTLTIQPQTLTVQSGTLQMLDGHRAEIARHVDATVIINGGTLDIGQVIRMAGTAGVQGVIEYRQGNLYSGVFQNENVGSNPGLRLSDVAGGQGTLKVYNDGPGQIWLRAYYTIGTVSLSGGSRGTTEFHYNNGGVKTVRIGDTTAGQGNQVSLRNNANDPVNAYCSPFKFVINSTPSTDADGAPTSLALFTTPDVTKGSGTDYAVFYNDAVTGRYLSRHSAYTGTGGRAYDPAADSFVFHEQHNGVNYVWDISYSGKGTWDATFDNITSVTGHGTGTDIVLIGRSSYTGPTWTTATDGAWSTGPWSGAAPGGAGAGANFFQGNTSGEVSVNVDQPVTVGALQFDNINRSAPNVSISGIVKTGYTLSGSTITIDAGAGTGLIRAIDGNHTIHAPVVLAGNTRLAVAAENTLTLSALGPSSVHITKSDAGTLAVNNIRAASLDVAAGTLRMLSNGGASKVPALTIADAATLDLNDNQFVTASPIGTFTAAAYTGITGKIQSGRNGGTWDGAGIITSKSDAASPSTLTTLAVATGAQVKGLTGSQTALWAGQTVAATDTLVMYTYNGDANLSGHVDADDYFQIDKGYASGATGFFNGDFNLDGVVNGDDYALIDAGHSGQGAPFASIAAVAGASPVPEPGAFALLILGVPLLSRRRRTMLA